MNLTNETQKSTLPYRILGSIWKYRMQMSACGLAPFVPQICDFSVTCRLFVACVASVSTQVCRESWDESNSQLSKNLCGNACYACYKQSYVRHETKPLCLPVLHLKAHLTARLWTHGLWLGRRRDEVSKSPQPVTLPAPTAAVSHAQLIRCFSSSESSFQVQGQREQKRQVACKYGVLHVCKGDAPRGNEHTRAARQTKASGNEQVNLETAVRLHRL